MSVFPKKDWISPKVVIRESHTGKGMFAKEPIKEGETVIIWGGETVNTQEAKEAGKKGRLVMQWGDDLWTTENRGSDDSYFLNHSCDPNLWMNGISTLIARRDIPQGEELTSDYALWEANENYISKWECQCGSPLCRHKITGKDYLLSELQERYKNHFSKLINQRINKLNHNGRF